jgi:hypothetical protein
MRLFTAVALALAIGLAFAVSPHASPSPDGLERVAENEGFAEQGRLARIQEDAPVPDYAVPGISDQRLATGLAGFGGTLLVFALGAGGAAVLRAREGAS